MNIYSKSLKFSVLFVVFVLFSCQGDFSDYDDDAQAVNMKISITANVLSKTFTDPNASSGEMMNNWFVVIASDNGYVEKILASSPYTGERETDIVNEVLLTVGDKTFYSFANITPEQVFGDGSIEVGEMMPEIRNNTIVTYGNNFLPGSDSGIPMTSIQAFSVSQTGSQTISLQVKRLYSKFRFMLSNMSGNTLHIDSLSLDNLTANGDLIYLFPQSPASLPEVSGSEAVTNVPNSMLISNGGKDEINIYVNESKIPSGAVPSYYGVSLYTTNSGLSTEMRYALLDDSGFDVINRNDLIIVPIILDDYNIQVKVVDYPPIGVFPAGVSYESGNKVICNFYNGGDFEIYPVVMTYSSSEIVPFTYSITPIDIPSGFFATTPYISESTGEILGSVAEAASGTAHFLLTAYVQKDASTTRVLKYHLYIQK